MQCNSVCISLPIYNSRIKYGFEQIPRLGSYLFTNYIPWRFGLKKWKNDFKKIIIMHTYLYLRQPL